MAYIDEARGFLDKANDTNDRAVRKVLLERALSLVQQAGMIEYASSAELASPRDVVIEDAPQGLTSQGLPRQAPRN